ncbi:MAG: glucose-6-phosphate dehydrogenase [Gemmataceae bacterium]
MPMPQTLIIFGASGDLTARKLIPSLYNAFRKRRLPEALQIVGVSRTPLSDDAFRERLRLRAQEFSKNGFDAQAWNRFAQRVHYRPGDASQPAPLEDALRAIEGQHPGQRLYYLSVAPELYVPIVEGLGAAGMTRNQGEAWRRLVIEKPFGTDLSSARQLNQVLSQHLEEAQIFRIDHYLGKETVQNILVFRFANTLFEPLWNSNFIDHIQITVSEEVQVGSRGDYYDQSGVLRDMVQNHLLQLLTFTAMESASRFEATPIRNEKLKVLEAVRLPDIEQAKRQLRLGQYEGYRNEKGVPADSRTPTYAALELHIDNWRWRGVPFFLRSGKALKRRLTEILIQFRCPPHLMFPLPPGTCLQCNRLAIQIQPEEAIHINFQSKVPDTKPLELRPTDLSFDYRKAYPETPIPEAYELLLLEAINGDATMFMRSDEIEQAWAILDPFLLAAQHLEPETYAVGSAGPLGAEQLLQASGRHWVSLS